MVEILREILPYLGGAIGTIVLIVLVREGWRSFRQRRVKSREEACEELIKRVHHLTTEGLAAVALELKKSFSMDVIEAVLSRYREESFVKGEAQVEASRRQLANLYDHLGIVEKEVHQLKEGKSWTDRAAAAEKIGQIGHPSGVLPLIAVLQDTHEETEVKSVSMRALAKIHDPRAIEPLVNSLGSPDPTTGQPLADVLAQFGKEAIPVLIKTLRSSAQEGQRTWVTRILGRIESTESVPPLINALADHSERVREAVVQSLGHLKDRRAIRPLNEILVMDPSPIVRETAAQALGGIGDEKAIEYLKRALGDMEYGARVKAMEALEAMGERVWPVFLEVLRTGDRNAQIQAAVGLERGGYVGQAIEKLGQDEYRDSFDLLLLVARVDVVETVIRSLTHSDFKIRLRLCEILREAPHSRGMEALITVVQKDPEWPVRLRALEALIAIGDERILPILLQALREEEESTRESILEAMSRLPQKLLQQVVPDLIPFLHDANTVVRTKATALMGKVNSDQVLLPLLSSLKDPSDEVRERGVISLRKAGPLIKKEESVRKAVIEALAQALKDPKRSVRMEAVQTLGALRDSTPIPALAQCFEWADDREREIVSAAMAAVPQKEILSLMDQLMGLAHPKARAGVAWTLGHLDVPQAVKLALTFLKDHEPIVRAAAAGAAGHWFERHEASDLTAYALECLRPYLDDPNERVRAAVVNALACIGDPAVIDRLLKMLETDPDLFVCQRAVLAIGGLGQTADHRLKTTSKTISSIRQWLERTADDVSSIAGTVALTFWQDESAIADGVKMLQSPKRTRILKGILKTIQRGVQDRFLKILSLDSSLFWKEELGGKEVAHHFQELLATSHVASERIRAIQALRILRDQGSMSQIETSFAKDPDAKVRSASLQGLCEFLTGPSLLDKILIAVSDPADEVRRAVISILKEISPKELSANREKLIPLLDSPLEEIRTPVAKLLARFFQNDWQFLADALLGTEKKTRTLGLIEALGRTGDPKAGELFLRFLESRDSELRELAIEWASESGLLSEGKLKPLLEDPQESVRISAIRGLRRQLSSEILPAFIARLSDPSPKVRIEIALGLGQKRIAGDERPIQILKALTGDLNNEVQVQALLSLFRLGEKGLCKELHSVVAELEKKERDRLNERLEREGLFLELTQRLQQDRHLDVRHEALEFLAALDMPRFASEIAESLQDPASEVRLAAIEVLGPLEDPDIQRRIEGLAQDPIEEVRLAVKRRKLRTIK